MKSMPPPLQDIKRGWGALAKVTPAWVPCTLLQTRKGKSAGEGAGLDAGLEERFEEFANEQFEFCQ
jgi:hypothetical protein